MAIIVKEGDHLKLTCAASGNPKPKISWSLQNGHAIPDGAWKRKQRAVTFICIRLLIPIIYYVFLYSLLGSNAEGSTLNITRINREHMGTYICEANNGIGEVARQNFKVQVHCKSLSVRTYLPTKGGKGLIKIFVVVVAPLLYLSHLKDTQMYHQDVLAKKCSYTSSKIVN